jgi:hypothetical protein
MGYQLVDVVYPWETEAHEKEPTYDYGVIVLWVNPFGRATVCGSRLGRAAGRPAATARAGPAGRRGHDGQR